MSNILLLPLQTFRTQMSETDGWQSLIDSDGQPHANYTDDIHLISTPGRTYGNFAIIDFGTFGREREAVQNGAAWQLRSGSTLMLYIRHTMSDEPVEPAAIATFTGYVSEILSDLESSAALPGNLYLSDWFLNLPPQRIAAEKRSTARDYYECEIELTFSRAAR